jgi:hypothetical protein
LQQLNILLRLGSWMESTGPSWIEMVVQERRSQDLHGVLGDEEDTEGRFAECAYEGFVLA